MVIQSHINYEKHKKQVFNIVLNKYGVERAEKFNRFFSERYDSFGRSFIDYRLALWLMDDYSYVNRIGTRWYACVGIGGTGKSTLMKNVFYFLDPTIDITCICNNIVNLVEKLDQFKTIGSKKALLLDEPDDEIHPQSKKGKMLRKIFGKLRQQQLFLGFCATDLKDIPPYIFRKLDGIFFTPVLGKYMFFKNKPRNGSYILQDIRRHYSEKGYKIFFHIKQKSGCLHGHTHKITPLDFKDGKQYLEEKKKDYENDIKSFINENNDKAEVVIPERHQLILEKRKQGMPQKEIGIHVGYTQPRVNQILKKYKQ